MIRMTQVIDSIYKFNKGIKSFGHNEVVQILRDFYYKYSANNQFKIISIGSGSGSIEHYSKLDWILVDPNPSSFHNNNQEVILLQPHFSYVDELIENNPSIVGNCLLFLNWCDPNDSEYDYEAIIKLKPIAIMSIYETFEAGPGGAGGEKFILWTEENKDYQLVKHYSLAPYLNDYNCPEINISIWQNKFENEELVYKKIQSKISYEGNNCAIS
jgi:hypothetical protein